MPQQLPLYCVPTIILVVGLVILVVMMSRPYVLREIVPADAADPAMQSKEEWREKALKLRARRNRFYVLCYLVLIVLVWIGAGVAEYGPRVVTALQPSPTASLTPTITIMTATPRPATKTPWMYTRTRDPNETITPMGPNGTRRSPTPRPSGTVAPVIQTRIVYQYQTKVVYEQVTVQVPVYITVVVTATDMPYLPTGTLTTPVTVTSAVISSPTPTGTPTVSPSATTTGAE
jgi:hypothetical protein